MRFFGKISKTGPANVGPATQRSTAQTMKTDIKINIAYRRDKAQGPVSLATVYYDRASE
jgi:hypothetical protein